MKFNWKKFLLTIAATFSQVFLQSVDLEEDQESPKTRSNEQRSSSITDEERAKLMEHLDRS